MARRPTKKAELFILFELMYPSEISKIFPEYGLSVRQYYMEWKAAKRTVKDKLTVKGLARRIIFGTEKG